MGVAALVAGTLLASMAGSAHAAEPCGLIKTMSGSARVLRGAEVLPASVGLPVHPKDRVVTDKGSTVGITLSDDTLLALGGSSAISIEDCAFNQTTHVGGIRVRVMNGVTRMITGLVAKQSAASVQVVGPHANIGVRGTDFIVEVPADAR